VIKGVILAFLLTMQYAYSKEACIIPDILLKTIKLTENEKSYPYYIRTNEKTTFKKFKKAISKYNYKKTKDSMLIDCMNFENCINITNSLINSKITNLDLGLFQINYNSYKYTIPSYFNKEQSYINACAIVEEKIKLNKGNWSWKTLASYHSMTPKLNKIYQRKLIKNYIKLSNRQKLNIYNEIIVKEIENVLVIN